MSALYRMTINAEQARIIQEACELYERLHAGQWFALKNYLPFKDIDSFTQFESVCKENIEPLLDLDKLYFERNAGDIYSTIRHRLSWDKHPEGGRTVDFDEPMKFGKYPLPKIERLI